MTIKEIAILAGTSRGTVDRVINKRGRVSKDVESRVLQVIKETNYRPNEVGRSLSLLNKKFVVGVVIASSGNTFFNLITNGIQASADKFKNSGLTLNIKEVDLFNKKSILKALDELSNDSIDALIISTLDDKDILEKIESLNVPVVAINVDIDVKNKISFVGSDYENCGRLAGNFINLVSDEVGKVGVVVGALSHKGQEKRVLGFKEVLKPGIEIVALKENFDDDSISYKIVSDLVERNPDMHLIVFLGAGIDGGLQALKQYKTCKALTVDQSKEVSKGLQSGLVLGTITQHPYTQGCKTIDILYDYLIAKKKVIKEKILDNSIILKESIIPHKLHDTND